MGSAGQPETALEKMAAVHRKEEGGGSSGSWYGSGFWEKTISPASERKFFYQSAGLILKGDRKITRKNKSQKIYKCSGSPKKVRLTSSTSKDRIKS